MLTGLSMPIQDVHLQKEAVVIMRSPLIFIVNVSGLHIDLDQLEMKQDHSSCRWQHRTFLSFFLPSTI